MTDRGRAPALAMIDALRERAEAAERERDELAAWKASALEAAKPADQLHRMLSMRPKSYLGWNIYEAAIDALQAADARSSYLAAQVDARDGTLSMTVARLGGMVDGLSTHRVNFLQRIDELRAIEREYSRLYARTLAQT